MKKISRLVLAAGVLLAALGAPSVASACGPEPAPPAGQPSASESARLRELFTQLFAQLSLAGDQAKANLAADAKRSSQRVRVSRAGSSR